MANNEQILDEWLAKLPEELRQEVKSRLLKSINYVPKIGIMGKSGAGKSTLINTILEKNACQTGGVGGCTRAFQEEEILINGHKIIFMDLPGVAENSARHSEYSELYAKKIKDLDLILWVIKVDDRANKNDEEFYKELIQYYDKSRILFVLSQCDKAEPSRDFDWNQFQPSERQLTIIEQNQQRVARDFNVSKEDVLTIACDFYEGKFNNWNIPKLITRIIAKVPSEAKSPILRAVPESNKTLESKKEAKSAFRTMVDEIFDVVVDVLPIPAPVRTIAKKAKDVIVDAAEKVWDFFFG